ncbi:uncharacterized protein LAESUDRAFT_393558 [Laetiporus sulphureus 93-53]|uniref:Protein CPL1-like domain-containing protein n=1 Tax=Laetiporus sulphureus 93-53 TaxID=1314785 RepID=A0A165CID0_9APHY|nr:uncharacterized protein LAESUDRAFT_393558 [Laetiporus sulphureus 93-53]KZT02867.1 hypothetical protein LAESUDRAFT_393558 [Laetiporus sulphureus 93-53]
MKFSTTFIPLLAAGSSLAAATRSSLTRGAAASRRDIIQSRQMHIQRDLLDVCASLDVDLEILGIVYGHLDICLCVSLIPDFIEVDVVAQAAVDVLGLAVVEASIQALIEGADSHAQCQYPPHAEPVCEVGWVCGFKCEDGFTPYTPPGSDHPTECVCDLPSTVCNGICGSFPNGCGSQSASRRKRAPTCASGLTACGVPGGSRGKGYECLDTTSELESCGGCVVSSPFSTPANAPLGRDCSAIPHVSSVLCAQSKCVVSACDTGYTADAIGAAGVSVLRRDVLDAGAIAAAAADVANLVEADALAAAGVSVL